MNPKLALFLTDFGTGYGPGVSEELIAAVQRDIGFEFPLDYLEAIREFNGGVGEIGENGYWDLFPLDSLFLENVYAELVMSQIPDYFLFGKDAADTGFAFHKQNKTVHEFGLMSNFDYGDFINDVGNSFTEFLEYLYNS